MMFGKDQCVVFLSSFMGSRCDVTSQHKLPTREEILSSSIADFVGQDMVNQVINEMLIDGTLVQYGPYLSDHEIDVL